MAPWSLLVTSEEKIVVRISYFVKKERRLSLVRKKRCLYFVSREEKWVMSEENVWTEFQNRHPRKLLAGIHPRYLEAGEKMDAR